MSPHDSSDEALRTALEARLEAAPEPPIRMRTRTLDALDALDARPDNRARGWRNAATWWSALAVPARFATAAAIVIVGGTIAFGTVKASHRPSVADPAPGTRISLDQRERIGVQLARSAEIELRVHDVETATRAVHRMAHLANGSIVLSRRLTGAADAAPAMRIVLHLPPSRFAATLAQVAALGTIQSRSVVATDVTGSFAANTAAIEGAQRRAAADDVTRLIAERAQLAARVDTSTIAVIVRGRDTRRAAGGPPGFPRSEPSAASLRRTDVALAGEATFCNAPLGPRWGSRSFFRSSCM